MARPANNGFNGAGRDTVPTGLRRESDPGVVAISGLAAPETLARQLSYDTALGRFDRNVLVDRDALAIDEQRARVSAEPDPSKLPWDELRVDIVVQLIPRPA